MKNTIAKLLLVKELILGFLVLLCFSFALAEVLRQNDTKLETKLDVELPIPKHQIKSVFIDKVSGDFIKEYDDKHIENGIITSTGKEHKLKRNELVQFFSAGMLITYESCAINEDSGSTTIRKYKIQKSSLELVDSLRFEAVGLGFNILNNGKNIILDDFSYDLGANLVIFDTNFKHKKTYVPFKNGSEFSLNCSDEHQTVILAKESASNIYKVAILDSSCNIKSEKTFTLRLDFRPNDLFVVGKTLILGGLVKNKNDFETKLFCLDENANILWDNSLILGYGHIGIGVVGDDKNLFILNNHKDYGTNIVSKLDIQTGRILKSINCDSVFSTISTIKLSLVKGHPNLFVRKYYLSNNTIYFSMVHPLNIDRSLLAQDKKNGLVCLLDKELSVKKITKLIPDLDVVDINLKGNNLMIVNSTKSIIEPL